MRLVNVALTRSRTQRHDMSLNVGLAYRQSTEWRTVRQCCTCRWGGCPCTQLPPDTAGHSEATRPPMAPRECCCGAWQRCSMMEVDQPAILLQMPCKTTGWHHWHINKASSLAVPCSHPAANVTHQLMSCWHPPGCSTESLDPHDTETVSSPYPATRCPPQLAPPRGQPAVTPAAGAASSGAPPLLSRTAGGRR